MDRSIRLTEVPNPTYIGIKYGRNSFVGGRINLEAATLSVTFHDTADKALSALDDRIERYLSSQPEGDIYWEQLPTPYMASRLHWGADCVLWVKGKPNG
jgi:hypothetical protein